VTSPFLKTETISRAIECFVNKVVESETNDSLFTVTDSYKRYYFNEIPVNHDGQMLTTQLLQPIQEENSLFYLFSKSSFRKHENRIGRRPYFFKTDEFEAWDIDTEFDFLIAQKLIANVSI
jgi:CMP-N-acetylneuraminic acid synthetase